MLVGVAIFPPSGTQAFYFINRPPGGPNILSLSVLLHTTLNSEINIGVRLLIFENFQRKKNKKNDRNAQIEVKKYQNCDVKIFKRGLIQGVRLFQSLEQLSNHSTQKESLYRVDGRDPNQVIFTIQKRTLCPLSATLMS